MSTTLPIRRISMKLSSKTRYGLACCLYLATTHEKVAVQQLSKDLELSPLYLQQVMSALKNGQIVNSTKGSSGGYELAREASEITLYDCLFTLEPSLFDTTESATNNPDYQYILDKHVFTPLKTNLEESTKSLTLAQLSTKLKEHQSEALMFYI